MSDAVAIIKAAAELPGWARAHNCNVKVHIGKSIGQGEINIEVTPLGASVKVEDSPTMELPLPDDVGRRRE